MAEKHGLYRTDKKEFWAIVNSPEMTEGGRSVCVCGHLGDGNNSEHEGCSVQLGKDQFRPGGHGACKVEGCDCEKFQWARWKDEIKKATKGM